MSIGTGLGLFLAGAILAWAVDLDVPYVHEGALGVILMVGGIATVVAAVVVNGGRAALEASSGPGTGLGTGVALLAGGAILFWAVDIDLPYVFDGSLGVVLMFTGILALAAAGALEYQRSRSRHVVERRYSDGSAGWN